MKKVISVIMMVIMVFAMVNNAVSENDTVYGDFRDNIWINLIVEDFNKAFENGEEFSSTAYIYEDVVYCTMSGFSYGYVGLDHFERGMEKDLEKQMKKVLEEDGVLFPTVDIVFVGQDENGEDIYMFTIMTMTNLNEFQGEKTGNGEIGFDYYGMKVLAKIYE